VIFLIFDLLTLLNTKTIEMFRIKLIFISILLSSNLFAQTYNQSDIAIKLDSLFNYCYQNNLFNGSVLVFHDEQIFYKKSFGNTSYDSDSAITEQTPFLLASLSKQFTATGIMLLQSKGSLNYDDTVDQYLIQFPYPQVTIRHLLNHTSGLPEYLDLINPKVEDFTRMHKADGFKLGNNDVADRINNNKPPLNFIPGSSFDYSNTGYLYLALIIEAITKKSYGEFMNETFFSPLEMNNTWVITNPKNSQVNVAIGYDVNKKNEVPPFLKVVGDGGIYSSAHDLRIWFNAINNESILRAYKKPEIKSKKRKEDGPYGFGWFVKRLPNRQNVLTHSGQFFGFTNSIFRDMDDGITCIVLSNNSHKVNGDLNGALMRIIYGMPFDLPQIAPEASIGKILSLDGIGAVKNFYKVNGKSGLYDFSERAINSFGYDLLNEAKTNEARQIALMTIKEKQYIAMINLNQSMIYKVASLYTKNKEDREDLRQEIALQLWKSFDSFKDKSQRSTWLYKVAMNTAIQFLKKEKRSIKKRTLGDAEMFISDREFDNSEDAIQELHKSIQNLNTLEKGIILLYLEEKNHKEIAEIVGISVSNVGTKIQRIKKKLKKKNP